MPTLETTDEFVILELKRMSDVTDQYVTRAKHLAIAQYASVHKWRVLLMNTGVNTDEHRCHSTRFNGRPKDSAQTDSAPSGPIPPLITSLQAWQPNTINSTERRRETDSNYM
jgi:hypothetical protein